MSKPILEIQNLEKTYASGVQALKGISLSVESGDFFALLGPNGAGKSTTIGIIASLVNKTGGKVFVNGIDIDKNFPLAKLNVGLVPQEFNFSIFEPVWQILVNQAGYYGLPRKLAMERAEKYLHEVQLYEKRNTVGRELSGGMKRRLMIARALIHEPTLLILDEPTAGVDIELRRSIWKFLETTNAQGTTVILTTHYLEEAEQLCRNIAIIDHGKIVEYSSMKDLLQKLDTEKFVLNLSSTLRFAPEISDYTIQWIDETTIEVEVKKEQSINALFEQLSDKNIVVSSLRNKANRLEELFLSITSELHHEV